MQLHLSIYLYPFRLVCSVGWVSRPSQPPAARFECFQSGIQEEWDISCWMGCIGASLTLLPLFCPVVKVVEKGLSRDQGPRRTVGEDGHHRLLGVGFLIVAGPRRFLGGQGRWEEVAVGAL